MIHQRVEDLTHAKLCFLLLKHFVSTMGMDFEVMKYVSLSAVAIINFEPIREHQSIVE